LRYSYVLLSHSFNGTMFYERRLRAKRFGADVLAFHPRALFEAHHTPKTRLISLPCLHNERHARTTPY
ncbi:MAG: hypothetical protein ACO3TX_04295, partial [Pseudomonadales bacterium]